MFNEIKKKYLLKENINGLKAEKTSRVPMDIFVGAGYWVERNQ